MNDFETLRVKRWNGNLENLWFLLLCCYVCWWPVALHVVEFIQLAICIRNALYVCVFHFHFCFSFLFKYDYQTENQHKFVYPGFGQLPGQRIRGKFKSTAEWENMSSHSITNVCTLPPTHSLLLCLSLRYTNKQWNRQTPHVTMEQHLVTIMQESVAGKMRKRIDTFKFSLQ